MFHSCWGRTARPTTNKASSASSRGGRPPVLGLVTRQFRIGRPLVLGLAARQSLDWSPRNFLGWSPPVLRVGRPPVLGPVARQPGLTLPPQTAQSSLPVGRKRNQNIGLGPNTDAPDAKRQFLLWLPPDVDSRLRHRDLNPYASAGCAHRRQLLVPPGRPGRHRFSLKSKSTWST